MNTNIKSYTDEELLRRVESLSTFDGWKDGVIDIWVRSNEDEPDKFDDKVYTFEVVNGKPKFIMVCSGTSNTGLYGLKEFEQWNGKGVAVLKSDIIVYDSHKLGKHKGQYTAYVQNKGFPYFRDNNRDSKAQEIGVEYSDIIGANCHKAGEISTVIGKWSVACLVRNVKAEFDKWLEFMAGRLLTVVILKEF